MFPFSRKTAESQLMVDETETMTGALEDLRAFCAVVDTGSISAAARQLGETKGSVSRRISRLEGRLGATLLARTPRAVSPTEEGLAFYTRSRDGLALLDEAAAGARRARSVPRGHLRVTAPMDLGLDVLPPLVVRFRELHPQITVELLVTDAPLDLASSRVDLALRATVADLPDMGYRASTLLAFHIGLYAAPAYLAGHGTPQTPEALAACDFVAPRDVVGAANLALTHARGRQAQVTLRPGIRTGDYASAQRIAAAGGGVTALPGPFAVESVEAGRLVPVLPEWYLAQGRVHAISLGGLEAPARVRLFRQFLRESLGAAR